MRHSTFTELLVGEFGRAYAASLARDHVLTALGDTAEQALARGIPVRTVWNAVCDDFDVPPERRLGADKPARR
ncbi:MAG TPA: DUF3046 domain-containing protein [Dermatophilaceae bacterium]|nr:DUF3046 domain-containing protein [Dermatophilaceae bacterium]